MAVQEPADQSTQELHSGNEQRSIQASGRNRKLAAAALMRLGGDCPPEWEDIATEVILHSQYSWSQIASRLGVTRGQAVYRFQRLLIAADVNDSTPRPGMPASADGLTAEGHRAELPSVADDDRQHPIQPLVRSAAPSLRLSL